MLANNAPEFDRDDDGNFKHERWKARMKIPPELRAECEAAIRELYTDDPIRLEAELRLFRLTVLGDDEPDDRDDLSAARGIFNALVLTLAVVLLAYIGWKMRGVP